METRLKGAKTQPPVVTNVPGFLKTKEIYIAYLAFIGTKRRALQVWNKLNHYVPHVYTLCFHFLFFYTSFFYSYSINHFPVHIQPINVKLSIHRSHHQFEFPRFLIRPTASGEAATIHLRNIPSNESRHLLHFFFTPAVPFETKLPRI